MSSYYDPVLPGFLEVLLVKAYGIPNRELIGKQNPYAILTVGDESCTSSIKKNGGTTPEWREKFKFRILHENALYIELFDKERWGSDDHIGEASISLEEVKRKGQMRYSLPVYTKKDKEHGKVEVMLKYLLDRDQEPSLPPYSSVPPYAAQGSSRRVTESDLPYLPHSQSVYTTPHRVTVDILQPPPSPGPSQLVPPPPSPSYRPPHLVPPLSPASSWGSPTAAGHRPDSVLSSQMSTGYEDESQRQLFDVYIQDAADNLRAFLMEVRELIPETSAKVKELHRQLQQYSTVSSPEAELYVRDIAKQAGAEEGTLKLLRTQETLTQGALRNIEQLYQRVNDGYMNPSQGSAALTTIVEQLEVSFTAGSYSQVAVQVPLGARPIFPDSQSGFQDVQHLMKPKVEMYMGFDVVAATPTAQLPVINLPKTRINCDGYAGDGSGFFPTLDFFTECVVNTDTVAAPLEDVRERPGTYPPVMADPVKVGGADEGPSIDDLMQDLEVSAAQPASVPTPSTPPPPPSPPARTTVPPPPPSTPSSPPAPAPPPPPPLPIISGPAAPPPPPPPMAGGRRKPVQDKDGIVRVPGVVEFDRMIMLDKLGKMRIAGQAARGKPGPAAGGQGGGQASNIKDELAKKLGFQDKVLADVEQYGDQIRDLAQEIRDAKPADLEAVEKLLLKADQLLDQLFDEPAVLRGVKEWGAHVKAHEAEYKDTIAVRVDIMRDLVRKHKDFSKRITTMREWSVSQGAHVRHSTTAMTAYFEDVQMFTTKYLAEQDKFMASLKSQALLQCWSPSLLRDLQLSVLKLTAVYIKNVMEEVDKRLEKIEEQDGAASGKAMGREGMLQECQKFVVDAAKFLHRAHDFVGGFDEACREGFHTVRQAHGRIKGLLGG